MYKVGDEVTVEFKATITGIRLTRDGVRYDAEKLSDENCYACRLVDTDLTLLPTENNPEMSEV